jgi:hypothetical protein
MLKSLMAVLAITSGTAVAEPSADLRAIEGPAVFFNLCASTVAGIDMPLQIENFKFEKVDSKIFEHTRPDEKGPYWDVNSLKSGMHALVHLWSNGNCSAEIVEAGEADTRSSFENDLHEFIEKSQGTATRSTDEITKRDGLQMTASQWLVRTAKGDYLFGLTTLPKPKYMTQHIMLLRKVR